MMKSGANRPSLKMHQAAQNNFFRLLPAVFSTLFFAFEIFAQTVKVVNNQPFAVRLPVEIRMTKQPDKNLPAVGNSFQIDGNNLVFIADLPASSTKDYRFQKSKTAKSNGKFSVNPIENMVTLNFAGAELGRLSWQIIYRDSKPEELKGEPVSTKIDFAEQFQSLPLKFAKVSTGAVFDVWRGAAESKGLQLTIELRAFHDGFLDINSELKNISAEKTENVYAAVLTRWQQPKNTERSVCYDNRIASFGAHDSTNFRTDRKSVV